MAPAAGAIGAVVASGLCRSCSPTAPSLSSWSGIGVFVITELVAAAYLVAEARRAERRRPGPPGRRGRRDGAVGAAPLCHRSIGGRTGRGRGRQGRAPVVALLAAVGYWIAFLPPRALRRFWQGTRRIRAQRTAPGRRARDTSSSDLWAELATTASHLTGAAIVDRSSRTHAGVRVVASSTDAIPVGTYLSASPVGELAKGDPCRPGR